MDKSLFKSADLSPHLQQRFKVIVPDFRALLAEIRAETRSIKLGPDTEGPAIDCL
jgi:hypothetical protein